MSDAVVLRERDSRDENPAMAFPIKIRINAELFIDRFAVLYLVNGANVK